MADPVEAIRTRQPAAPLRMDAKQKRILTVLLGAQFMLAADFSIFTVALPVIGDNLGLGLSDLQWITTGFALPAAGLTLLFGRAADLVGRRRLFLAGIALLAIASLVGSFATGPGVLIAARVAQGVATAITVPSAMSLLTTSFPEGPLRRRALGINGALLGGGFTAGALLGGLLTGLLSWRWSFLINVPVAALLFAGALLFIRDASERSTVKLDVPGAVTVTAGLLALAYGITTAGHAGWGDAWVLVLLGTAVVLLVAFWFVEQRSPNPLVPVWVLKRRTVALANFGGVVTIAMATGISILMTLYMQEVLGYSAVVTGLALGGPGLLVILGGVLAPRSIGRFGSPRTLALSLLLQAVAFGALLLLGTDRVGVVLMVVALAVGFLGHAFSLVSYMVTATSGLADHDQGLATGLTTMSMQIGITLGIPVLSAVATARTGALAGTTGEREAVLGGLHAGTLVNAAVLVVSAVAVWAFLRHSNTTTERK
ncbi:MFS transporter [Kibdelosporangium phytohabitans]|uniref:MFS transporter n=1 Tax=Kibdelosporangium phytohabitans TaxID=860235 RepID=A0A0N9HXB6_9PSEU|nr:MFS transporter [Kibdelosporangium phytohabitans]ALG09964.1 MFS transporter [Kibdelosporangium phytohabitans]MBE1468620.1 MFS family permease [Kibdelosporangium phytohabitans]